MPASPWRAFKSIEPRRQYTVSGSALHLKGFGKLPAFIRLASQVQKQLETAEGAVGFSLTSHMLARDFWTTSVWESPEALKTFVRTMPHSGAMRELAPHIGKPAFVTWTANGSDLPPQWSVTLERLRHAAGAGKRQP